MDRSDSWGNGFNGVETFAFCGCGAETNGWAISKRCGNYCNDVVYAIYHICRIATSGSDDFLIKY